MNSCFVIKASDARRRTFPPGYVQPPTIRRRPQDRRIDRLHLLDNGICAAYSRPDSSGIVPEATVGLWPALSALGFTGNDPAPPALSSSRCAHLNLFCRRARFAFVPLRPVVLDLGNDRIRFWPLEYN